jgi:glucosamine--fructose-6-phosphate aminotransferase (isomerizing)
VRWADVCGIVGYVGDGDAVEVLASGLENLEYRGYDSAGVALAGDGIEVFKGEGTVDDVDLPATSDATRGLGHTRWSTHGEPTDANAHPHTDCGGDVAVVHNGIISNYTDLEAELDGHAFESDTDTEVVPHLVEEELRADAGLRTAVTRTVERLSGSFALGVAHPDYEGLVFVRKDSPLVVGHGDDGTYVGSDVTAFVEHTRRVTYLEDGDVAEVTAEGLTVYEDGRPVDRRVTRVEWDADDAGKGGYDHYMHKEIHEQPRALRQSLSGRVDELVGEVDLDLTLGDEAYEALDRVEFVGCGTSYHAGMYGRRLLRSHTDLSVSVSLASEYAGPAVADDTTLVVGVTQSGETADTLSALRTARAAGVRTAAVTNTVGSTVTRAVEETVLTRAGPEIGVAATKTFATQVATLALLAVALGRIRGTLAPDEASDVLRDVRALPGAIQAVLDAEESVRRLAASYADSDAYFFVGRELGYPVALESALKLKEISYEHAEGFAAGELKHGPLALVTERTPVVALLTDGAAPDRTLSNVREVEARGAPVVGVSTLDGAATFCTDVVSVPSVGAMEPLAANVALQLFAYHLAKRKGRNIDRPRHLAKSVTVE